MKVFAISVCLSMLTITNATAEPIPTPIEQRIREIYAEKYPDNFSMQKILIQDQLESYRFIQRWTSEPGLPQDVFNRLKEIYT